MTKFKIGDHVVLTPYGKQKFLNACQSGIVTKISQTLMSVKKHGNEYKNGGTWLPFFWELENKPENCT